MECLAWGVSLYYSITWGVVSTTVLGQQPIGGKDDFLLFNYKDIYFSDFSYTILLFLFKIDLKHKWQLSDTFSLRKMSLVVTSISDFNDELTDVDQFSGL